MRGPTDFSGIAKVALEMLMAWNWHILAASCRASIPTLPVSLGCIRISPIEGQFTMESAKSLQP